MHIRKEHAPGKHRLVIVLVTVLTLGVAGVWGYQVRDLFSQQTGESVGDSWREMVRQYDEAVEYSNTVQQYLPDSPDNFGEVVADVTAGVEAGTAAESETDMDVLAQTLIEKLNASAQAEETVE